MTVNRYCVLRDSRNVGGQRPGALFSIRFIFMSDMFGCEDWECDVILEDNLTLNRIMAEPKGTARHMCSSYGLVILTSYWNSSVIMALKLIELGIGAGKLW